MNSFDAVVIGAGPNGLVAANVLADAGWDVVVLEAATHPGGAVWTEELTAPGFHNDVFSAFYPFTAASPIMQRLHLDEHGLEWTHAPHVLAHPRLHGAGAVLDRDLDVTVAGLARDSPGDGAAFASMFQSWRQVADPLLDALLSPFPPVRAAARLTVRAGPSGLRELARLALLPLRQFVHETFTGEAARLLLAGSALHADLTPETAGSALFGWLLTCLGQQFGFPVPVGGAGRLTDAMVARAASRGVTIHCAQPVLRVEVTGRRATGVLTATGERYRAKWAVLADCDAQHLMLDMVGPEHLPADTVQRVRRMQRSSATFKLDWALRQPIPWMDPGATRAGTVHVAEELDELSMTAAELAVGRVPTAPFLLVGQMTTADPTRSPPGTEAAWAYTHVPMSPADGRQRSGGWNDAMRQRIVEQMEARIESLAPGFIDRIIARHVLSPSDMQARNANLVGGDISGGTAQLHQQLIFRPTPGWGRAETPVRRLYLASASAHPGGAVHGGPGSNAARAAILHRRLRR